MTWLALSAFCALLAGAAAYQAGKYNKQVRDVQKQVAQMLYELRRGS